MSFKDFTRIIFLIVLLIECILFNRNYPLYSAKSKILIKEASLSCPLPTLNWDTVSSFEIASNSYINIFLSMKSEAENINL